MENQYAIYHHGIKGQHWGIRRTPAQLGHLSEKLQKKNQKYSKLVAKLETRAKLNSARGHSLVAKGTAGALSARTDFGISAGQRRLRKGAKQLRLAEARTRKAERFKRKILKNEKKISKIDKQIVFNGKEYVERLLES
jgi:hypothetical protein